MDIQEVASNARNSLSNFCMTQCNAFCCTKGFIILSKVELDLLTLNKSFNFSDFIKPLNDNKFSFNFSNSFGSCPRLIDFKCSIHKNPLRPLACDVYPIFVDEVKKEVYLSPHCYGIKENKLYAFIHEFIKLGYKVVDI